MRLHHVAIQVLDLDDAAAFYVGVLGLRETRRQAHAIWVDADGTILMLEKCPPTASTGTTPPTLTATAWASPDPGPYVVAFGISATERDTWRQRLAAAGVAVSHESGFTLYFRDPWGTRLALSHHPEPLPGM